VYQLCHAIGVLEVLVSTCDELEELDREVDFGMNPSATYISRQLIGNRPAACGRRTASSYCGDERARGLQRQRSAAAISSPRGVNTGEADGSAEGAWTVCQPVVASQTVQGATSGQEVAALGRSDCGNV